MRSVVMKFGGSSVVDSAAIDRVCRIVANERAKDSAPVVVVSALGGVTDALLALADAARRGDASAIDAGLESLTERHATQVHGLGLAGDRELARALDGHFFELREALARVRGNSD